MDKNEGGSPGDRSVPTSFYPPLPPDQTPEILVSVLRFQCDNVEMAAQIELTSLSWDVAKHGFLIHSIYLSSH